jgi:hypothetical protein
MTRQLIFITALLVASLVEQQAIAESPADKAGGLGRLLAYRRPLKEEGPGMLVVDVRLTDKSWFKKPQSDRYEVELTPALGGDPQSIPMRLGAIGVATVSAGRYCVSAIVRDGRSFDVECRPPYLDVTAHSIDFTGRLDVSTGGGRAKVTERELEESYGKLGLSAEQLLSIDQYLGAAAVHGTRTFFVSSPSSLRIIIRLFADGTAELEEYALANSSYTEGQWSGDAELVAAFHGGSTVYRFTRNGDDWAASSFWMARNGSQGIEFPVDQQVAVSERMECWHWTQCGSRIHSGVVWNAEYSWLNGVEALNGAIELEFELRGDKAIAKPQRIKVVSSDLSDALIKAVAARFADTRFSADLIPQVPSQRFRMKIDFRLYGKRLTANLGPMTAVEAF